MAQHQTSPGRRAYTGTVVAVVLLGTLLGTVLGLTLGWFLFIQPYLQAVETLEDTCRLAADLTADPQEIPCAFGVFTDRS